MENSQAEIKELHITLDSHDLPVSYVSSMLRVLQAAVREVARGVTDSRALFAGQPQPVLMLSTSVDVRELKSKVFFADSVDSTPMLELSAQAFDPFMAHFANLLKMIPQPGLWGPISRRQSRDQFETETEHRLDELRVELRHFSRATISFGNRSISFDGDQLEIQ